MSYANPKPQGKRQDAGFAKQNQNRGNKKWNSNNTVNGGPGGGRGPYGSSPQNAAPQGRSSEDPDTVAHMHDRMLFLLGNLTGSKVQVKVKNGTVFEGILQGATTESDLAVSLVAARKVHDPNATKNGNNGNNNALMQSLAILSKDLMEINALDVDLTAGEPVRHEKDTFKTDIDISNREYKERELHKWVPGAGDGDVLEALEDTTESSTGSWDQFAANEKLFGLKTDFNEEIYTTRLDRNAPDFKHREKWAIEMANEIQRSSTNNPHMMEERNMVTTDDSGMDEEDRYGAVIRDPNVYVPPAMRKQKSAAAATPSSSSSGKFTNLPPDSPLHKLTTGTLKPAAARPEPVNKQKKPSAPAADKQPKRIEAEIANTFRRFAMLEKEKLQNKRQALHKKEQSDRLAELVKFHQTFKLDVPVPPDLLPLLAKGKKSPSSSDEKSSSHTSSVSSNSSASGNANAAKADAEKQPAAAATATASSSKPASSFKFNIKASEFKPNPAAAVFVPGAKMSPAAAAPEDPARNVKKFAQGEHVKADDMFKSPFAKGKQKKANAIGPTWPFGTKQFRHQFSQQAQYAEDVFTGYPAPGYGYNYPIRYQYMPGPIPVPQQGVPYMNPQFVPPMPGAPMPPGGPPNVAYSPQMANGSPHGSPFPQGYSSPQRSHVPPPNGAPPPVYPYQGGSMPVRYPEMMTPPTSTPVMMHQRPIMVEGNSPGPYPPGAMPPPNDGSPPPQMESPAET